MGDADEVELLRRRALDEHGRIDVWISAAAAVTAGALVDQPVAEVETLFRTNVIGAALGARAALATFEEQGAGDLILIASLLGVVPNPVVPTYVASKFAVRGLALSLRQGVAGQRDVHVSCVLPGPIDTPLFQRAGDHTGRRLRSIPPAIAPERVAAAVVRCVSHPRRQVVVGVVPRLVVVLHRLAPRAVEWGAGTYAALAITTGGPEAEGSGTVLEPGADGGAVQGGWRRGGARRRLGSWIGSARAARSAGPVRQPEEPAGGTG